MNPHIRRILMGSAKESPEVFITATGGTITTDGNFKVHTFTSSGNFVITSGSGDVEYLIVSGGGGGSGGYYGASGGGAGGLITDTDTALGVGTYPVVVGEGGAKRTGIMTSVSQVGNDGNPSSWNSHSVVGGAGGRAYSAGTGAGACGGGGNCSTSFIDGGIGSVGFNGGNGVANGAGGGGGGMGGVGQNGVTTTIGGNGGIGLSNSITGSPVIYCIGGGGTYYWTGSGTVGNASAGTGRGSSSTVEGTQGTDGRGHGGGSGFYNRYQGQKGGNGIVILRYQFQ